MSVYDIALRLKDKWEEPLTGAPRFIDTDHGYIHDGLAYQTVFAGTETATTDRYVFVTPSTGYIHWRPVDIDIPKGQIIVSFFEDTTAASTGPAGWTPVVAIFNHSRTSTNTAAMTVYSAATSTGGTQIDVFPVFASTGTPGATRQGASDGKDMEWVLKQNTQYRVHFNTTEVYYARMFWYEEAMG